MIARKIGLSLNAVYKFRWNDDRRIGVRGRHIFVVVGEESGQWPVLNDVSARFNGFELLRIERDRPLPFVVRIGRLGEGDVYRGHTRRESGCSTYQRRPFVVGRVTRFASA